MEIASFYFLSKNFLSFTLWDYFFFCFILSDFEKVAFVSTVISFWQLTQQVIELSHPEFQNYNTSSLNIPYFLEISSVTLHSKCF